MEPFVPNETCGSDRAEVSPNRHSTYEIVHDLSQRLVEILLIDIMVCKAEVEISFADLEPVGVVDVTRFPRRLNEAAEA